MPELSIFTPCGMLELTSEPSHGERIYNSLLEALSPAFDMSEGTYMEAWAYATAMMLAQAQYALDRAGNQANPLTAYDLIPLLEADTLIVPTPGETVPQRQAALAVAELIARGARPENLISGLKTLLGANFLSLSPVASLLSGGVPVTPTVSPANPGNGPGNWVDARKPAKWLQLVDPVVQTGAPSWCAYQSLDTSSAVTTSWAPSTAYPAGATIIPTSGNWTGSFYRLSADGKSGTSEPAWPTVAGGTISDGSCLWTCVGLTSPQLTVGETVTVQGENTAQSERVTVTAVAPAPPAGSQASSGLCFEATFTKAHDIGASLVSGPFPFWWSTRRQLLVVCTSAAAVDRESRRKVNDFLHKTAREVDLWGIVQAATTTMVGGTIGPFKVGTPMGTAPVGTFTFANST